MPKETVYLSGSIDGHKNLDKAKQWRNKAQNILTEHGFNVINPLQDFGKIENLTPKKVYENSINSALACDIMLVEMTHSHVSYVGTSCEMLKAYENGAKIILWGNANRGSYFLWHICDVWLDSLTKALRYLTY